MSTDTGRRGLFSRWARSQSELDADSLEERAADQGATLVRDCARGEQMTVAGRLRSVTLRPRAGVPALEAELYDGSGHLALVWLGRRHIAGIEPGRRVRVHGMVTSSDGEPAIYNPRYELVAKAHG